MITERTKNVIKITGAILAVILSAIAVSGSAARGALYMATNEFDKRYITQEAWIAEKRASEINELKADIRQLRIKQKYNETTPSEDALLEELELELQERIQ